MSEKSKGDTSRIVNNPLLSASVTGLTFDDFPSAPLLLPAAPPIERSPPPVLDLNTDAKDSASGQSLNTDSDAFSEINLNASAEEEEYSHQQSAANFISPLEENPTVADTSLLSQAASSFSQLPSVASTVFSTFSKVIKDYTPTGQESSDDSVLSTGGGIIEPPAALASYDNFYSSEQYDSTSGSNLNPPPADQPPPEPPKFYSPTEFTNQPPATTASAGSQNTYRLSAKKKTYAHIPGLSSSSLPAASPIALSATPPLPVPTPPSQQNLPFQPPQSFEHSSFPTSIHGSDQSQPFINSGPVFDLQSTTAGIQPFVNTAPQAAYTEQKKEERSGLFSFTKVVAPVWQNLSGLVSKGNSQERETPVNNFSSGIDFGNTNDQQQSFGYGAPPISTGQYFSNPTGEFGIVNAASNFSGYQHTPQPQQLGPPPTSSLLEPVQPSSVSAFFGVSNSSLPPQSQASATPAPPSVPLVNTYGTTAAPPVQFPPIVPQSSATPPAVPLVNPYQPTNSPLPAASAFTQPTTAATPPASNNPPLQQGPPRAGAGNTFRLQGPSVPVVNTYGTTSAPPVQFPPIVPQPSATPPAVPLVNPYQPTNSPLSAASALTQPPTAATPPASNNPPLPQGPPRAGAGNTFRLQKGTRHYKAPLEIATNPAAPSSFLQTSNNPNAQPNPNIGFTPFNPITASQPIHGVPEQYPPPEIEQRSSQPIVQPGPPGAVTSQPLQPPPIGFSLPQFPPLPNSQLQGPPKPQSAPLEPELSTTPEIHQEEKPSVSTQPLLLQPESQDNKTQQQSLSLPPQQIATAQVQSLETISQALPPQALPPKDLQCSLSPPPKPKSPITSSEPQEQPKAPILLPTQGIASVPLFNPVNQPLTEPSAPFFSAFGQNEQSILNPPNAPQIQLQQQPPVVPFGLETQAKSVTNLFSNTQPLQNFFTQQPAFNPFVPPPLPNVQNEFNATVSQPRQETSECPISNVNTEIQSVLAPNTVADTTKINNETINEVPPRSETIEDLSTETPTQQLTASDNNQNPSRFTTTSTAGFLPNAFGNLNLENNLPTQAPEPAQLFTVTNYFASQAFEHHQKARFDLNANKPASTEPTTLQPSRKSSSQSSYQPEPVNFFSQVYKVDDNRNATVPNLPDPISFFDSFQQDSSATSSTPVPPASSIGGDLDDEVNSNFTSDTRSEAAAENSFQIQNFFNNPPQNLNQSDADFSYQLVGSNLAKNRYVENLNRAGSPQSNIVEPPSSACSEFSTSSSYQNTSNLNKVTNDNDLPEYLREFSESIDPEIMAQLVSTKATSASAAYQPAAKHWFYKKKVDDKFIWTPFSHRDSHVIEAHFSDPTVPKIVAVEGGRYDVNITERQRLPIYWSGEATEVRRCSWFYKGIDSRYVPYDEAIADKLETEYEEAFSTGEWHRKISLPSGETVVFHGATVLVHFLQTQAPDSWGAASQTISRSRIVKRDLEDFAIEPDESNKVDHLLFMVHGIGSVCDLKFRTVEEVVDEFRSIATQLIQSHYKNSTESGRVGRVEILPISWHSELHSEESGIDEKLKAITLESMPKLRNFANDTLLDILFYTSPIFCQNIMDTVGGTMNKVYLKYCQRNPQFNGGVSLAGHSLGSLILFDLLSHQKPIENTFIQNSENPDQPITPMQIRAPDNVATNVTTDNQIKFTIGPAGTGQAFISYPQLAFQPKKFFALGSPIGMFVTIRGIDKLGLDFKLPTCPGFFNIFHPYDPVAYRIEALVNRDLSSARPVVVPHHKGRKRMHLELRETMTRVGADIKQKIVDAFKNTMDTVYQLTAKQKVSHDPKEIEKEVDKVLEEQLNLDKEPRTRTDSVSTQSDIDGGDIDLPLGNLNEGRRIDHVLQEGPLEFINEYLFALTSHVCYWESADTILFIMKEIYSSLGVQSDSQVPQQSMTIERPQSNGFSSSLDTSPIVEQ